MRIDLKRVPVLPVFKWLAQAGNIAEQEMLRTFNCGVGMIVVVEASKADAVSATLTHAGESVTRLGEVIADNKRNVGYDNNLDLM